MELTSSIQRRAVAGAIGVASVGLSLFASEPSALLVAIAVVCICIGWKAGLAAVGAGGVLAAAILLSPAYEAEDGAVRFAIFVAAAMGLWLIVKIFGTVSFYGGVYQRAGPNMADIPGLGWCAHTDGRRRFVNRAMLDYVGVSAEEMRRIMDADDYYWAQFIHPDDVE
ncbi:MAG: PAS domain-containing sensor histidine kinase, partial [Mesorhizobium sp.]